MKKNQPLNSSRRHLLARLPSYLCTSVAAMGGVQAVFGDISTAYANSGLDLKLSQAGLPKISLTSDIGTYFLSELADRPILINFWATWCAPCVAELSMLEEAAQILAEDKIMLVLVSMDRGGQLVCNTFQHGKIRPILHTAAARNNNIRRGEFWTLGRGKL